MAITKMVSIYISKYWENIKYALQQVEGITVDASPEHYNELFAALLSDRAQCFFKYDPADGRMMGLMITEILESKITGKRSLCFRAIYGFEAFPPEGWGDDLKFMGKIANDYKCTKIVFDTANPRIREMALKTGFKEVFSHMEISL